MSLIPELYAKPVLNAAAEEIRRIKEHYDKALKSCPGSEEKRQYTDVLHRKGYLVVKVVSTIKINSDDESS